MARATRTEPVPTTEPTTIESEFVSDLAFARIIDGMMHLAFARDHVAPPELAQKYERQIKSRLIMTIATATRMCRMLDSAINNAGQNLATSPVSPERH